MGSKKNASDVQKFYRAKGIYLNHDFYVVGKQCRTENA